MSSASSTRTHSTVGIASVVFRLREAMTSTQIGVPVFDLLSDGAQVYVDRTLGGKGLLAPACRRR